MSGFSGSAEMIGEMMVIREMAAGQMRVAHGADEWAIATVNIISGAWFGTCVYINHA